jgi:hypothetical protein
VATLIWRTAAGAEQAFVLANAETTIGRDPANLVRLDSAYVSKRHAVVRLTQSGFTVTDLGSSNGTRVNGAPVSSAPLVDGDVLELGAETLTFRADLKAPAREGGSRRRVLMVGGLAFIVIGALFAVLLILGGKRQPAQPEPRLNGAVETPVPEASQPVTPAGEQKPAPPGAATDPTGAVPDGPETAPLPQSADAGVLYDQALAHVRGGRLVEARRLLTRAGTLDPANPSIRERLREVEATLEQDIDRRLAAGQQAFKYLRLEDAVTEWEQVVAMTDAADPRHQQAASGIERARARLAQR